VTKKKKAKKKPSWKKSPELKRVADHIGKFIDKLSGKDLIDLSVAAYLVYVGAKAGRGHLEGTALGAGSALLGYKLARTSGGGVVNPTQIAGLGILAALHIVGSNIDVEASIDDASRGFKMSFRNLTGIDLDQPAHIPVRDLVIPVVPRW